MQTRNVLGAVIGAVLLAALPAALACSDSAPLSSTPGWKAYRNSKMKFELEYPASWEIGTIEERGNKGVHISEKSDSGKPKHSILIFVHEDNNPDSLPIDRWFVERMHGQNPGVPPNTLEELAGRPALRKETGGGTMKIFQYFAWSNDTDIFDMTFEQRGSGDEMDADFQRVLESFRFLD